MDDRATDARSTCDLTPGVGTSLPCLASQEIQKRLRIVLTRGERALSDGPAGAAQLESRLAAVRIGSRVQSGRQPFEELLAPAVLGGRREIGSWSTAAAP
jgi:hypothetical protein